MSEIELQNLTKSFKGKVVVDNLNLNIEKGQLVALLGINGAGKTTTIKMLSTLLKPTSGDAKICGFSIIKEPYQIKKIINVSPQETALASNLTVRENLEFIAQIYGFKKQEIAEQIKKVTKLLSLENELDKKSKVLSGGYQRRLSIAMALISNPKVLFLDEPSLGLDVFSRAELWETIKKLKKDITIILTTHYMEEAENLADKVAILCNGKLKAFDNIQGLINQTHSKNLEETFIKLSKEVE